jgi:hypothetical protein
MISACLNKWVGEQAIINIVIALFIIIHEIVFDKRAELFLGVAIRGTFRFLLVWFKWYEVLAHQYIEIVIVEIFL